MARPKKIANSVETRDQILNAARLEFGQQGIGAPLDAIAKRCGITRPSLLHHFKSKQALVGAVVGDILEKARRRLLTAIGSGKGDYVATINAVIKVLRDLEEEEKGVGGVLLHAMLNERNGEVTKGISEFIEVIHSTAIMAGAASRHPTNELRAAIAQLLMGEIARIAMGDSAEKLWGQEDGIEPLFKAYFLSN